MTEELIGYVPVDAGLMYVGDPCYVMGADASSAVPSWMDWLAQVWPATFGGGTEEEKAAENLSVGYFGTFSRSREGEKPTATGIAVSSGYGDGCYPVYIEWAEDTSWGRRVKSIRVEFIDESENEDYNECSRCGYEIGDWEGDYCEECRPNECWDCGTEVPSDDTQYHQGEPVCESCYETRTEDEDGDS